MNIWIDYDLSFGEFANEVDDGLALVHAVLAEKRLSTFTIKGISSVHGNTFDMKFQRSMTSRLLKKLEREDIPFFDGAGSETELGQSNPAVLNLIKALEDGPLTVLGMGRLTNIASTLILRPDLKSNISKLVIMGGRKLEKPIYFGNRNIEFPDMNIDGDLPAVKKIIELQVPLLIIPTECMTNQLINKKHLGELAKGSTIAKLIAKTSRSWRLIWKLLLGSPDGFIPWDVFMVSYFTHPEDFLVKEGIPCELRVMKNSTHRCYQLKKRKKEKDFLVVSKDIQSHYFVDYCFDIRVGHIDKLIKFWKTKT